MSEMCKAMESDADTTNGDSDYYPSNDSSVGDSPETRKQQRLARHQQRKSRTLMRPWLIARADEGSTPGLEWIDGQRTLLRIPWLHASTGSYSTANDSKLFVAWAEHTEKHIPGERQPDAKRWKANFRCALNSLPDVQEVSELSCKKGKQAFKVYRFDTAKKRKRSCRSLVRSRAKCSRPKYQNITTAKAKTIDQTVQPLERSTAVVNWLTEQRHNYYSDISNDNTNIDDVVVVDEGSRTGDYETTDSCRSMIHLEREEMVVASRVAADYWPRIDEFRVIPKTVEEYSTYTSMLHDTTHDSSLVESSSDECGSPTDSVDSGVTDFTDETIAEMIDSWQSESEGDGRLFQQLIPVDTSYAQANGYEFIDRPTEVRPTHA